MSQNFKNIVALIPVIMLFAAFQTAQAQTYTDAVESFNEALETAQGGDHQGAIDKFLSAHRVAGQVGSEADEIKARAETQIVRLQFTIAGNHYRSRDFNAAIEAFNKTIEYANRFGDTEFETRASNSLPVVYLQRGNGHYRNNQLARAEEDYKKALELNPNYARALYQLGLIERSRENTDAAIDYYDRAIQLALNTGDQDVERQAEAAARDYLTYLGSKETEAGRYRNAIQLLNQSMNYDMEHANTYYRLAEAHNNMAQWDEAINSANQALRHEQGGQVARAKIYFELGMAYMEKGNNSQACDAFRNAAFGQFRAPAEHHMEHDLKCGSSSR